MKIRLLELFGGIGACSKALERLRIDYEIADYVEIDKYAVASFNAIHDTNFEPQDIKKWDKNIEVDIITHGSPCQDFSLAGKGAGGDEGSGTRSSLMYETVRIVKKLKPQYVIWENVPNVLSKKHIHNFQNYIQFLDNLGYKSAYEVLNAKDYGIPQNRERLFVVSVLNGRTRDLLGLELYFDFPQPIQLKLKLKDLLEDEVDEKYYLSKQAIYGRLTTNYERYNIQNHLVNNWDVHQTIMSRYDGAPSLYIPNEEDFLRIKNATKKGYLEAYEGDGVDISSRMHHHRGTVQKDMIQTLDSQGGNSKGVVIKKDTNNYVEWKEKGKLDVDCRAWKDEKVMSTIMTTPKNKILENSCLLVSEATKKGYALAHEGDGVYINRPHQKRGVVQKDKIQTLKTSVDDVGVVIGTYQHSKSDNFLKGKDRLQLGKETSDTIQTTPKEGIAYSNLRIRKLTPKECWRLMGFDDEDFKKAKKVNSDTQLYKQAGNSIVVNVLEAIFKELFKL